MLSRHEKALSKSFLPASCTSGSSEKWWAHENRTQPLILRSPWRCNVQLSSSPPEFPISPPSPPSVHIRVSQLVMFPLDSSASEVLLSRKEFSQSKRRHKRSSDSATSEEEEDEDEGGDSGTSDDDTDEDDGASSSSSDGDFHEKVRPLALFASPSGVAF